MASLLEEIWYATVGVLLYGHKKRIKNPLHCRGRVNKMNIKLSLCVKRSDNNNDVLTRSHRDIVGLQNENQGLL